MAAADKIVLGTADVNPDGSTTIFGGGEGLKYSGATPADTRFLADESGEDNEGDRVRRMPFSLSNLDSFPIAVAKQARGKAFQAPEGKDALIDFPGPPGTIPVLSFADVEKGDFDAAKVRGKIVVIGATSPRGNDLLATSTSGGGLMSRAEVQAAAIDTTLRGFPLRPPAGWLDVVLALLVAAVAPLVAIRFRILVAFARRRARARGVRWSRRRSRSTTTRSSPSSRRSRARSTGLLGTAFVSHPTESPAVNRVLDRIGRKAGNQRTRRLRALLLLSAALGVVSVTLVADAAKLLRNLDYSTIDARFAIRGTKPPPKDVVIVALDDKTLNSDPRPTYPLGRDWYARTVRNLTAAGAKVIAVDVEFSEASEDPKKDSQLVEALHDARNVVLSTTEPDSGGTTQLFAFDKGLGYTGGEPAITLVVKDSDGRVRRMLFGKQGLPTFRDRGRRGVRRPPDRAPGRAQRLDRLRGRDSDGQVRQPRRRRAQPVRPGRRPRQDGRDRRDPDLAAGSAQHVDDPQLPDARAGDPGERDRDGARRVPAARGAVVGGRAPDRRRGRGRSARRPALRRRARGVDRRGSRWPSAWSARRSPSSATTRS